MDLAHQQLTGDEREWRPRGNHAARHCRLRSTATLAARLATLPASTSVYGKKPPRPPLRESAAASSSHDDHPVHRDCSHDQREHLHAPDCGKPAAHPRLLPVVRWLRHPLPTSPRPWSSSAGFHSGGLADRPVAAGTCRFAHGNPARHPGRRAGNRIRRPAGKFCDETPRDPARILKRADAPEHGLPEDQRANTSEGLEQRFDRGSRQP